MYTPSDDLISTGFKQKGVVPEIVHYLLKEFTFLLGRHALDNEIPRMTAPRGATGSGHDGALTLSGAPFQGTWARSVAEDASPDYNSNSEAARFSSWAVPGSLAVTKGILEVILNDDSPTSTRVVDGVLQPVALTTAEQRLVRKNALKAHGTLRMALPDKHQLKFNSHKDVKTLMEAIEKRFRRNTKTKKVQKTLLKQQYKNFIGFSSESLDQIHDKLQKLISHLKILRVSLSQEDINLNTDSTNEPVSVAVSVSAVSEKIHVSFLLNVDSLSNAVIYSFFASQYTTPQLKNDDLKQIDADDLEEMDLKWQIDILILECYNYHKKGHFAWECRSPKDTRRNGTVEPQRRNVPVETSTSNALVSQCDGVGSYDWSFEAEEEPTNYVLMAFSSLSSSSNNELRDNALVSLRQNLEKVELERDDLKLNDESFPPSPIYNRYQSGNGYHVVPLPYTGTFMPPKPDLVFNTAPNDVETDHSAFNVKLSPTKPDQALSHTLRPSAPIIKNWVSDSKDESETKTPQNVPSFIQSTEYVIPTAVLTQSKPVPITAIRPVSTVVFKISVTKPRQAKTVVTKSNSPLRRHINHSPSSKASTFPPKVTAVKAPMVNAAQVVQRKWDWIPKCLILDYVSHNTSASITLKRFDYNDALGRSKHMTGNMSYLFDFEELNSGYVTFRGNPKGGKISRKATKDETTPILKTFITGLENQLSLKVKVIRSDNGTKFKNLDLNQFCRIKGIKREFSVPRTPQQNGITERKNRTLIEAATTMLADSLLLIPFWVEAVNTACSGPTWLFDIDTLTKTMNYQPVTASNQSNPSAGVKEQFNAEKAGEEIKQQYVLFLVWSSGFTNPQNTDEDAAFDKKGPEFDRRKPESEVNVSPSNSAQSKKHDDKTKREAKDKSHVESLTAYRNLSVEFEDFFDNSINEVNAVGTLFPVVGRLSPNSTNTFSAVGLLNVVASPKLGKSSYIYTSQLPDDPDMPELEDITYSNDEDNVGAEADFNNLEPSITVSPILTTRVHKDHLVTQIIGDLSSATQTRSMTRVAKDQGGLSQINSDDFYTCMFACFLSQEEPKRVHQALKDASWIEAMQEDLLQIKMQKVWVLVDLPHEKRAIGHTQKEGVNYEEVFALVARIEAIRLFLDYASFIRFLVYQIDVKSAFLYGTIKEEVYVCQPLGFEDLDHPDKVYKVVKALYGLHQTPRASYETLANYLLENGFQRGKMDQTLFIKRQKGDILLVQIYVDDIIFGLTNKDLCKAFEKLMNDKFQMSSIGELTFFLGL
uniref:Integrase catalytic domain-containing protein n=1 Tax=Tanacetum cinerariifolium TaxID=118510 RepID=A0A6L2KPC8_TANCI|nr:hypothetical protein [Tanacetum cinerariifolium]